MSENDKALTPIDRPQLFPLDPYTSGEAARAIAEVISLSYGEAPEEDAPLSRICGPNNEPLPCWMAYEEQANAVLAWIFPAFEALEKIAREINTYKGHGDYETVPLLSAHEAQSAARSALSAIHVLPGYVQRPSTLSQHPKA